MWCTRWYIPLLILPIPKAPAYFLVLYLISLTVHSRPCFYCVILLSAMFISSCYWQPVALDAPLAQPWSENITTFGDLLNLTTPVLPPNSTFLTPPPTTIKLGEHCWCDWADVDFFKPFNVTRWELQSVVRRHGQRLISVPADAVERTEGGEGEVDEEATVKAFGQDGATRVGWLRYRLKAVEKGDGSGAAPPKAKSSWTARFLKYILKQIWKQTWKQTAAATKLLTGQRLRAPVPPVVLTAVPIPEPKPELKKADILRAVWRYIVDCAFHCPPAKTKSTPDACTAADPVPADSPPKPEPAKSAAPAAAPPMPTTPLPLLRTEYDLRPYGVELIIDFNWGRKD